MATSKDGIACFQKGDPSANNSEPKTLAEALKQQYENANNNQ